MLCNQLNYHNMGLLKKLLFGAAVYGVIQYVTRKDENGKSIMDDLKEKAPEWKDKAKRFKEDLNRTPL